MEVKKLYFLFVIVTIFCFADVNKVFAQCDENTIKEANLKFKDGDIDELLELLTPCIEQFSTEHQEQAYRLLSMAYIGTEQMELAETMVANLLLVNPRYTPNPVFDSPTFIAMIEKNKKKSTDFFDTEVVSASKHKQKLSDAPAIMSVITAQQIKHYGYNNVAEALASLPGIDMIYDYSTYNIGIRGINGGLRAGSRMIKLMIDNQPVSFRSTSENFLGNELIPIQIIERIEVIRGPESALYGANAFLGVVNIITKKGITVNGGVLSAFAGLQNGYLSNGQSFTIANRIDNIDFMISGARTLIDRSGLEPNDIPGKTKYADYKVAGREISTLDDISESNTLFGKINIDIKKDKQLNFDFNLQNSNNSAQYADWGVLEKNNKISLLNYYLRSNFKKTFDNKIEWITTAAYSYGKPTDDDKLYTNVKIANYQTRKLYCHGIDLATELDMNFSEKNSISVGADFSNDKHGRQTYYRHFLSQTIDNQVLYHEPTGTPISDTTFRNFGFFVNTSIYPFAKNEKFVLSSLGTTLSVRYDYHNIYGNVFNFRFANIFKPNKSTYIKLLYETSFKAPSSTQLYTTLLVPGDLIGNPNLEPEKANTFEIAIGSTVFKQLVFEVCGFYNTIKDKVELQPLASNIIAKNTATIKSIGCEASLIYNSEKLEAHLNYSYQRSTAEHRDIYTERKYVAYEKLYPQSMLKGGFQYRIAKTGIRVGSEVFWVGERIASAENTNAYDPVNYMTEDETTYKLASYLIVDLIIAYNNLQLINGKETEFSVKITNLTNADYYYPGYNDFDIQGMPRFGIFRITQHF